VIDRTARKYRQGPPRGPVSTEIMITTPNRYDWLRTHHLRRSSLQWIERGIRSGAYDGEARASQRTELVAVLTELLEGGDLTAREGIRVARVFGAIGERDLAIQQNQLRENSSVLVPEESPAEPGPPHGRPRLGSAADYSAGPDAAANAQGRRARPGPARAAARVGSAR
jgi:hypothetical protein